MTDPKSSPDWEEEFELLFIDEMKKDFPESIKGLKYFIRTELQKREQTARQEGLKIADETKQMWMNEFERNYEKARQEGVGEEREQWINQPTNKHDKEIRQDLLKKVREMIEGMKSVIPTKQLYEGDKENENLMLKRAFFRGHNKALSDILEELDKIK